MAVRLHWEALVYDLRYAARTLRRSPAFTLVALSALALGIGAGTAVFSVVDRILFRSLPYPGDDRLVSVGVVAPIVPQEFMLGSDYVEWRQRQSPFESLTSWTGVNDCDLSDTNPVRLACAQVEANFLATLGIRPIAGRDFTPEEDRPNAPRTALLTYGLWKARFGGDPRAVGRTLSLDGQPARIIGVLPPDFELPLLEHADVIVPQALDTAAQRRPNTGRVLRSLARLKPGITIAQAQAALQPLFRESLRFVPPQFRSEVHLRVRSLRDRQTHDARAASWMLLAAVLAVLAIACANIANLLLARSAIRRRELAVRASLGAGRVRLIRQMLTESLLLAVTGGAAGCALAAILLRVFMLIAPEGIPRLQQANVDMRVLLFALASSLAAALLFGLAPALAGSRAEYLAGWHTVGARHQWSRNALVSAQICVSLILLAGAGLLLRSFWNLQNQPLGLRSGQVLTASIALGTSTYAEPVRRLAFFEQLEGRLRHLPGAEHIAFSDSLPPDGPAHSTIFSVIGIEGRPPAVEGTGGMVTWRSVTPEYFAALGIPILRGRTFQEADRDPHRNAVIVSNSLARRLFPNENPLGQRIQPGHSGPWLTVIGISRDVKNDGLADPAQPEFYVARKHAPDAAGLYATLIVRGPIDPRIAAQRLRSEIAALDPTLPVDIETLDHRLGKLSARPRFNALLLGFFAVIGLFLAAIGLYGVMSFLVAQRTREIGVRMALAATPGSVARLVLTHAARWTAAGAMAGLAGSLASARLLQSLLFGVSTSDPWTLASAALLLLIIALSAAWIPSRRAAGVDPMQALRHE